MSNALATNQYVLLDYYASWCENCVILNKVLHSKEIEAFLSMHAIRLIRVDVSAYNQNSKELLNQAKILGLPTLHLYDRQQHQIMSISGRITADALKQKISQSIQ